MVDRMRLVLVLAALLAAGPARSAQGISVSVEELARSSDAVVRGRVTAARSAWSEDGLRILTTYDVRQDAVLRGRAPRVARVVVPGGVVGRTGQRVDAAPTLGTGEDVILFLRRAGDDAFVVNGLAQGKYSVAGPVARPDLSQFTFVGSSVRAGERRSETMPLEELERRVRSTR
jgi:hypothetical protein